MPSEAVEFSPLFDQVDDDWTSVATVRVERDQTSTMTAAVTAIALSDIASLIRARNVETGDVTQNQLIDRTTNGNLLLGSVELPVGTSTVDIEAKRAYGEGSRIQMLRAAAVVRDGTGGVVVPPDDPDPLTIAAYPDQTFTDGTTFALPFPAHNGNTLRLEQETSPGVWTQVGTSRTWVVADSGNWRWATLRFTEVEYSPFTVTVTAAPVVPTVLISSPSNQGVIEGDTATFTATAQGENLTWQVFVDGVLDGGTRTTNNAFTEATVSYVITPTPLSRNGESIVIAFTGADGDTVSTIAATLTVTGVPIGLLVTDVETSFS